MPDINTKVSERIRFFRQKRGLSQEALANVASMHRAYIGQVERGEKKIGIENLEKIAIALKVDIKEFFQ